MGGTIFEGGLVDFGNGSFLHEFEQLISIEGEEANKGEIIIDLEVLIPAQQFLDGLRLEALQILIGGLRVIVEADGLKQALEGEHVLFLLVSDCEHIEDLLGRRVASDLVFVLPADHLVERGLGRGMDWECGEAATGQREDFSEAHLGIIRWGLMDGWQIIFVVEMRGGRKQGQPSGEVGQQVSRKEMRRQKKEEKKQRIRHHFKNSPQQQGVQKGQQNRQKTHPIQKAPVVQKEMAVKRAKKAKGKSALAKKIMEQTQDDKLIKLYEQKLGVSAGKDKYGKMAKKYGFDDDIFDFLQGITKKVTRNPAKNQPQGGYQDQEDMGGMQEEQMMGEEGEQEGQQEAGEENEEEFQQGDGQFDEEYDRMFDNLDEMAESMPDMEEEEQQEQGQYAEQEGEEECEQQAHEQQQPSQQQDQQQPIQQQPPNKQQASTYRSPFLRKGQQPQSAEQRQVRRSMTGFFNKLSDGNILLTFRQFVSTIQGHPRSLAIPLFSELFTKFNLMVEKPLFHLLATNVALAAGLHRAFGNRLMAPLLHGLTVKFLSLCTEGQDEAEVLQFGYSKRFQRMKNYTTIISLLYNYGSITGQFLESLVGWLVRRLDAKTIQLLYIVVQKCGVRIRQNDPSALKAIITAVKDGVATYRQEHTTGDELQKISFIQAELAQIKFNKKVQAADQRMAFLQTFISKNVPKEIQKEKEVFTMRFQELMSVDSSRMNWWQHEQQYNGGGLNAQGDEDVNEELIQVVGQKKKLLQLAKSFHMVTEVKRNIFLCLMDSKDYLQATQRILDLRIKNYQDVATVLVEICTLQPNFNPYYPLVAAKLASVMPKFRLNLQYAIWDHLKLIHQYELRRTANLAKFAGKLISDPLANSSLSVLRFFPDLSNIRAIDGTFLSIFFSYFFRKVKREYLSKLVSKLRQDNNRSVKEGIKEYLSEFQPQEKIKDKVKLCRRLLMVELDERKLERGDDDE